MPRTAAASKLAGFALLGFILLAAPLPAETCGTRQLQTAFAADGAYSIRWTEGNIRWTGKMPAPGKVQRYSDHDALGAFCDLHFQGENSEETEAVRVYPAEGIVTLTVETGSGHPEFPSLAGISPDWNQLGYRVAPFAPFAFNHLHHQGPWVLFDNKLQTVVVSPGDHFFVSDLQLRDGVLHSGFLPEPASVPPHTRHTTVFAFGTGMHTTLTVWGHAMQAWAARPPVRSDAGPLLRGLSYWTDNGAFYYYKFDPRLGYTGTLLAVADKFHQQGVPLHLMQLDSWFYPKGPEQQWQVRHWEHGAGGAYRYEPDKELFPDGIGAFAKKLDLPMAVHGRWVDASSPYRQMYKMSGNVIIDPRYWKQTAAWLRAANIVVYEQDWLGSFAQAKADFTAPEAYHDEMAHAMRQQGIALQYCMPAPADYLQGVRYPNLTTIRTSDDRFERAKWDEFLYDSQIAYALGIWPWSDVFMSSETANLVLATLSSGPVGVGDAIDRVDTKNLLRAARADGVLVKPDSGIRPLDRIYLADAHGETTPMIAVARTRQPAGVISYVFAYSRHQETAAVFTPAELGYRGTVFLYNWRTGGGKLLHAAESYQQPLADGWGYAVAAPVNAAGLALVGDPQMIATAGKTRLTGRVLASTGAIDIALRFAAGETAQSLMLYAAAAPRVRTVTGRLQSQRYDAASHLLYLTLTPDAQRTAQVQVIPATGQPVSRQRPALQ